MKHCTFGTLAVLLAPIVAPGSFDVAAQSGTIVIEQPAEWATAATRGIIVRPRQSLRIVGVARHPEGVREVRINGARAALSPVLDGGIRFTGFLPIGEETEEAVISIEAGNGDRFSQAYPVDTQELPGQSVSPSEVGEPQAEDMPERGWLTAAPSFEGERWAVVIGISDYEDPQITPLRYAHKDAQAFYEFLVSPQAGLGGFRRDHVLFLTNEEATFFNIRRALVQFLQQPTEDDVVYVYFAGHGAPDPTIPDDLYLIPYDGSVDELAVTGISMADVRSAIRRTKARQLFVFTDACHSGAVASPEGTRALTSNPINNEFLVRMGASQGGYLAFTSSEPNQYSIEGPQWGGGHGVFTYHLVQGLRGAADQNGDRVVDAGELVEWVRDRVRRTTSNAQVPTVSATSYDRFWPMSIVASDDELASLDLEPADVDDVVPDPSGPIMLGLLSEEWWAPDSLVTVVGSLDTVQIRLTGEMGQEVAGHQFAWSSSNPTVARVDQFGVIQPVAAGMATITARVNRKEQQIPVRVYAEPVAVRFTPSDSLIDLVRGEEVRLTVSIELPTGEVVRGLLPSFELQDTLVVARREPGVFDARREGEAAITGRLGEAEWTWTVRVRLPALKISQIRSPVLLGDTIPLSAHYVGPEGSEVGEAVGSTWESTNSGIVRVSTAGAEAVGVGRTKIIGSVGSSSDTTEVFVLGDLLITTKTDSGTGIHTLEFGTEKMIPILADDQSASEPALSPDGSQIAFVSGRDNGRPRIFLMDSDGTNLRRVTLERSGPLGLPIRLYQEHSPAWSHDGARVFFVSNNTGDYEVYSVGADGNGLERVTSDGAMDRWVSAASDAPRIVFERVLGAENSDVFSALSDGTEMVNLTAKIPRGMRGSKWIEARPAILPGGKQMVFVEAGPNYRSGESLALFDLTSSTRVARIAEPERDHDLLYALSPDGNMVAYHRKPRLGGTPPVLVVADLDGTTLRTIRLDGQPEILGLTWAAMASRQKEDQR